MAESPYAGQVREYLAYCDEASADLAAHGGRLDPKYHPSADGAVKMIPQAGDPARAAEIRAAYVTEVSVPAFGDGGVQRLHAPMLPPEPLPEPEPEAEAER